MQMANYHGEQRIDGGQGTTANVIAGVASFFFPGLGQLVQGRPFRALFHFVLSIILWMVLLGWIMHIWSALEAAWYQPK